jgi:diguanylate cyclase (GGDEF)-like protein
LSEGLEVGLSTYDHQLDRSRRAARQATEIPRVDGSGVIRLTASLGVASMPEAARDMTSLIAAADSALYRAKSSGKSRSEQATADEQPSWWVAAQGPATERRT